MPYSVEKASEEASPVYLKLLPDPKCVLENEARKDIMIVPTTIKDPKKGERKSSKILPRNKTHQFSVNLLSLVIVPKGPCQRHLKNTVKKNKVNARLKVGIKKHFNSLPALIPT